MHTLLALLALAVVPSSGFHFGLPTPTPTLPGFPSIQPTPISTCRVATVGRSIRNVCPTGYTAITNGECCIASQVTYSGSTAPPFVLHSPVPIVQIPTKSTSVQDGEATVTTSSTETSWLATAHKLADSASTTPSTCIDAVNPTTGRSECAANLRLCNNIAFRDWMKIQCPRTCG